jgi:tellurite methyltransferase
MLEQAKLLEEFSGLLTREELPGPVLDLASGDGHNGVYLATLGLQVTCCDRSGEALETASRLASEHGVHIRTWQADLEVAGVNPLPVEAFGAIVVFRYLHRPLLSCIRKALRHGGILVYETFTVDQSKFGKPRNPAHLLESGELREAFADWEVLHWFEGEKTDPLRAVAQIVCRRPQGVGSTG